MREKLILASGSPRRLNLLTGYGYDCTVMKPDFDESAVSVCEPSEYVMALARGKNECVTAVDDTPILSADTVVSLNGKILEKPRSYDEAYSMLSELSDNTHTVFTGVCIRVGSAVDCYFERADVTFYKLTNEQICAYIDTGSPFDKAGGYGIQDDMGIAFVNTVKGELSCAIGLPMAKINEKIQMLREQNKK